jgi:hypothetical protein
MLKPVAAFVSTGKDAVVEGRRRRAGAYVDDAYGDSLRQSAPTQILVRGKPKFDARMGIQTDAFRRAETSNFGRPTLYWPPG